VTYRFHMKCQSGTIDRSDVEFEPGRTNRRHAMLCLVTNDRMGMFDIEQCSVSLSSRTMRNEMALHLWLPIIYQTCVYTSFK
jgi:hypothetical protein